MTFFPYTILFWRNGNQAELTIDFGDGSVWVSGTLKPDRYQFRFSYQKNLYPRSKIIYSGQAIEQMLLEMVDFGRVEAPFVELHLVKP